MTEDPSEEVATSPAGDRSTPKFSSLFARQATFVTIMILLTGCGLTVAGYGFAQGILARQIRTRLDMAMAERTKRDALEAWEAVQDNKEQSEEMGTKLVEHLTSLLVGQLQISITNLHVRIEGSNEGAVLAGGVVLRALKLTGLDTLASEGLHARVRDSAAAVRKCVSVEGAALYFSSDEVLMGPELAAPLDATRRAEIHLQPVAVVAGLGHPAVGRRGVVPELPVNRPLARGLGPCARDRYGREPGGVVVHGEIVATLRLGAVRCLAEIHLQATDLRGGRDRVAVDQQLQPTTATPAAAVTVPDHGERMTAISHVGEREPVPLVGY